MNLLGGIAGIYNTNVQKAISNENLQYQKDVLDYNKQLQNTIFMREDNAVQRRAQDLASAGLSKTLAAGSAANAGAVIPVKSPERQSWQLQLPDILSAASQIKGIQSQTLKNQADAYNIQYAKEHGLPYGATPNAFTEGMKYLADVIEGIFGKRPHEAVPDAAAGIAGFVKNSAFDLGYGYLYDNNLSTEQKLNILLSTPDGQKPFQQWHERNVVFKKNGQPANPYLEPQFYNRVHFAEQGSSGYAGRGYSAGGGRSW